MKQDTDGKRATEHAEDGSEENPGSESGRSESSPPPSAEELVELQAKAGKADEHWDRLLRLTADLENFKKRAARERQDAIKYANESLLQKLIPIVDNFDMALAAAGGETNANDSVRAGVAMIHAQLKSLLAEAGLEEINAQGEPFDPNLHEAVSQRESKEVPEGHVLQEMRKGYRLRERLIRPASVVVAKKPSA